MLHRQILPKTGLHADPESSPNACGSCDSYCCGTGLRSPGAGRGANSSEGLRRGHSEVVAANNQHTHEHVRKFVYVCTHIVRCVCVCVGVFVSRVYVGVCIRFV